MVLRFWEHQSLDECAERIAGEVRSRRAANIRGTTPGV
jgi:hypothetical protein